MKLIGMDLRICAFLMVCLCLTEGEPQRGINSLQNSPGGNKFQSSGKVSAQTPSDAEDPKKAKIMKQINKVNDDGSYTFGYEADDGSFRVETRTKDGVVKGKYGYVDANGKLKVMEYTAGERTEPTEPEIEDDEASEESQSTPAPTQVAPRVLLRSTKSAPLPPTFPSFHNRPVGRAVSSVDQSVAAQTPSKVTQVNYNSNNNEEESDDDEDKPEDDEAKDVNNGQYFRAVTDQPRGPGAGAPRQPTEGPRYVPTTQLGPSGQYLGSPQGGQGFGQQQVRPQQFGGPQGFGGQGPQGFTTPVLRQQPGQSGPPQYTGQQGPSPYSGQPGPSPFSGQPGQSPYAVQQGPSPFGGPQGQYEEANFDGRSPPQFGQNPNVQIQFRGSPNEISTQDKPRQQPSPFPGAGQPQQFQGFGGAPPASGRQFGAGGRQLGAQGQPGQQGQQYVPNIDLDGFSEDADEDGYVDDVPKGADVSLAQAQEKQGQAVRAGGGRGPEVYRPQVLGPQGVLQGGRVTVADRQQPGRGVQGPFLGQGQQQQGPQLTDEQLQQLLAQYQDGPGNQFLGQQFGGFPGQGGQGFPGQVSQGFSGQGGQSFPGQLSQGGQGFSQGRPQQQSQFLGGGRPGQGAQGQQGQFLGQQNPLLQGQYIPGQGQGEFSGFPQQQQQQPFNPDQFRPTQGGAQQGQFLGQGQGLPQGFGQQGQGLSGLSGLSAQGGLPSQGSQFGQGGSPQQSGRPQSAGLPFDFNPYAGLPGQSQGFPGQSQGFQGQPQQSFPGQQSQQGFPGQYQGFPGQSEGFLGQSQPQFSSQGQGFPSQSQGFPGQGGQGLSAQQGGFPIYQGGFPGGQPQQAGFPPGRFPGSLQGQQGQISQQLLNGQGVQLGGGQARAVQAANGSGSFGAEARKVTSAAPETKTTTSK